MLHTKIILSTTDAEYPALIQVMHDVIKFLKMMKEISFIFHINITNQEVFCKFFEDNQIVIAIKELIFFTNNKAHFY